MLSAKKLTLSQAATYYSKDNYYTRQEGKLYGKGLEELGLTADDLTHENFVNLLEGKNPQDGEVLGSKRKEKAVPAVDFTFSAPKSLGVVLEAAEVHNPDLAAAIKAIHEKSVDATLKMIEEKHIKTRITKNKKERTVKTGNMIASQFVHDTSRALDPLLHTHCVIKNLTFAEGRWYALDLSTLLKKKSPIIKNLGKYYRQVLKQELQKSGFNIRVTNQKENFFELKHVNKEIISEFSKRRKAIEAEVKKIKEKYPNMSDSQTWQKATLNSRDSKGNIDREVVRKDNLDSLKKYVDIDEFLSRFSEVEKIETKVIDSKSLEKIIKQSEKEITNKHHKFVDNICDHVISKLPKNVDIDVYTIRETIEKIEDLKVFKKEKIGELKTMHDVVRVQLRKTKFDTRALNKSINKIQNKTKLEKEEILENARAKQTTKIEASGAAKVAERYIKRDDRGTEAAGRVFDGIERKYKDFDGDAVAERIGGTYGRRSESQRADDDTNRAAREDNKFTKNRKVTLTREDLRRDTKLLKNLQQNIQKTSEIDR